MAKKKRQTFRQRFLNKINALPPEKRKKALLELEVHNYCKFNEDKHILLINDTPHPLMTLDGDRYSRSGNWYMGGMN